MTRTLAGNGGHAGEPRILEESPAEVFRELVGQALAKSRLRASEHTEFYLVNLLTTFMDARKLHGDDAASPTLVDLLATALACCPAERLGAFRRLGDFALFVSGYFGESVTRLAVDIDYYVAMGGQAYGHASRLAPTTPSREVFDDLSRRFVAFMDVIGEVGEQSLLPVSKDALLLQAYNQYVRTGSRRARRKLAAAGLVPIRGLDTRYRQ